MATELSSRIARLRELASFNPRPLRPGFSGREPFDWPERLLEMRQRLLDQAAEPYVGITTDGTALPGLYDIQPTGVSTRPIARCRQRVPGGAHARAARRPSASPSTSDAWRRWSNISPFLDAPRRSCSRR